MNLANLDVSVVRRLNLQFAIKSNELFQIICNKSAFKPHSLVTMELTFWSPFQGKCRYNEMTFKYSFTILSIKWAKLFHLSVESTCGVLKKVNIRSNRVNENR